MLKNTLPETLKQRILRRGQQRLFGRRRWW